MDDVTLLPLKVGIYIFCACFALLSAVVFGTRRPRAVAHHLPHAYAPTRLLGHALGYWALGVWTATGHTLFEEGTLVDGLLPMGVLCMTTLALVGRSAVQHHAVPHFALFSTLCWGGYISGLVHPLHAVAFPSHLVFYTASFATVATLLGAVLVHVLSDDALASRQRVPRSA